MRRIFVAAVLLGSSYANAAPAPPPRARLKPPSLSLVFHGPFGAVVVRSDVQATWIYVDSNDWEERLRVCLKEMRPAGAPIVELRIRVEMDIQANVCQGALGVCNELSWVKLISPSR